jgi:hypothetical protein
VSAAAMQLLVSLLQARRGGDVVVDFSMGQLQHSVQQLEDAGLYVNKDRKGKKKGKGSAAVGNTLPSPKDALRDVDAASILLSMTRALDLFSIFVQRCVCAACVQCSCFCL